MAQALKNSEQDTATADQAILKSGEQLAELNEEQKLLKKGGLTEKTQKKFTRLEKYDANARARELLSKY